MSHSELVAASRNPRERQAREPGYVLRSSLEEEDARMAEHTVEVKAPALDVGKVDVVFTVRQDGQVHGRLKISKGGVEWMQRSDSKKAFHMSWNAFDRVFSQEGEKGPTRSGKRRASE